MEKTEINKLADILYEKGIPFRLTSMDDKLFGKDAMQIHYPTIDVGDCIFDFVCHKFSYGGKDGLLEMMDHRTDEVLGYLTAEDAFEFILHDYVGGCEECQL